jgi:hypothetical protein
VGADRFITPDLQSGRMIEVIERSEPAIMVCHWTGIYWNGQELGFKVFQEVVRRLHARYDHLIWMKLSEVSRYWAAKELTRISRDGERINLRAPFACPDFTVRFESPLSGVPELESAGTAVPLKEVKTALQLQPGTWHRNAAQLTVCFALTRGLSSLTVKP